MAPKMAILVLPATAVVIGLIIHSLKLRGGRETLYFFAAAALFGVARGNVIWWITTVHFQSKFPYIFQKRLLGVYHDSLTADAGWIICLYIGSYLAYRICDRLPGVKGRVFPMVSLACLFNACLSYAVEATAMNMGWWQWNLSTKSSILSDVPVVGVIAWFSVGFDFLIPYYTIRHYRAPGQWWPFFTLLIFPLHMGTHLLGDRVSGALPITPYNMWHWAMVLATLCLPFLSRIEMRRPWLPLAAREPGRSGGVRFASWLPAAGLGVVISVLLVSDLGITKDPNLLVSKVPLAFYAALAVRAVDPLWVAAAAAAAAAIGGRLFLPPLVVPLFYFVLRGAALLGRLRWLAIVYILVPVVLTGIYYDWSVDRDRVDRRYASLVASGRRLADSGDNDGAIERLRTAAQLKPNSLPAYESLVVLYSKTKRYDEAEEVLRKMLDLRPISAEVRVNMGNVKLLRGDLDEAERWYRMALEIDPSDEYSRRMLRQIESIRERQKGR
jgi:pentatricopeptide repeat protein